MTLASDRAFPRHSHDQLGIGVIISGAHRSWSGIGHVEAEAGDMIMVNPSEMHDGTPVAGGERAWQMLYFDPLLAAEITNDGDVGSVEMVRAAARDPALTSLFARLYACITAPTADPFLIEETLLRLVMHVLHRHGLQRPPCTGPSPSVAKALARLNAVQHARSA